MGPPGNADEEVRVNIAESAMSRAVSDLDAVGVRWALIGGLAVSYRSIERFTKDADFAVAVSGDSEAETTVFKLRDRGYSISAILEQDETGRMSTVRMISPLPGRVLVDLLFASSGLEREVVEQATEVKVASGLTIPMATVGHLIAMKLLSRSDRRPQDMSDLMALLGVATARDLEDAKKASETIVARGFNRDRDLPGDLQALINQNRK
jgi:predicted nucleotidyltransferase